jgi:hypothetical protein
MKKLSLALFLAVMAGTGPILLAQGGAKTDHYKAHHEVPDAGSVHMALESVMTSPAYTYSSKGFFTTQVNINASGQNILGDAANEPSIAIDPTNPDRIMIGWRQFDNVNSNFRQAGYAYSLDGGQSWTFPGSIDAGVFRSDPVLGADPEGNFYYNSLTSDIQGNFTCKVFKTEEGEVEWDEGTPARGGDKQWMAIDNTDGEGSGNNYSFWTQFYSSCFPGFFTRSTDLGGSYEPCRNIPEEPYWGTLTVGAEGELYVVGTSSYADIFPDVNPEGLMGQAWVDVDRSDGPGSGNVYVLASVARESYSDPADVMFARSTDGGENWDDPVRINDDLSITNYQWFGTMSVAPNGRIDAVWLDTRMDPLGEVGSALFYSYSVDQGLNWSANKQLSAVFDPHLGWPQQDKMGDYFDMVSDDNGAHLAWANTLNGEQDVYYAYITPEFVGLNDIAGAGNDIGLINYPNPFRNHTSIHYSLPEDAHAQLAVYGIYGKLVHESSSLPGEKGTHIINFDASDLPAGIYMAVLKAGGSSQRIRMVKAFQ